MSKVWLKGTLAGGFAVFLWCFISWMILPWHQFGEIKNELQFSEVLNSSITEKGVYILPNMPNQSDRETLKKYEERKLKGPTGIFFVNPNGSLNFSLAMFLSMGVQLLGSFLFTYLLSKTPDLSLLQKASFVGVAAMTGGVISHMPYWVWWQFPTSWTFVQIIDLGIGWFLGGLAIAKFTKA